MPSFRLVPFTADPSTSSLQLTGTVERVGSVLRAAYSLSGDLSTVRVAMPATQSARRDGLWQTTCFELFVAPCGHSRYLEINVSPCGDWNAYSFSDYREGMAPLSVARFTSQCAGPSATSLELDFEIALEPQPRWESPCDLAVTAVLEHTVGTKSYWALSHNHDRPDFHRRDSFRLKL